MNLTLSFRDFFDSEKSAGIVLIICTLVSIALANSPFSSDYLGFWHHQLGGLSIELWVNDALMAIFFLLVGLELERELYNGELSDLRNALLPICAAAGGIAIPALIHFGLNTGTPSQAGAGIPMATDIAFALGVLALAGKHLPITLKVFLTALAVMDDLGAIIVIGIFYTSQFSLPYLIGALAVFGVLIFFNRVLRCMAILPYLIGGILMWYLMLRSGVHATLAGVMLAFAIPFSARSDDETSPSHRLEHFLHKPVAFLILPIFALANTGLLLNTDWQALLQERNSLGIILGLVAGKPIGIVLACVLAVRLGLCRLPAGLGWPHIAGAGMLGGIGFTMSIFITQLAFAGNADLINASKIAILIASTCAGILGLLTLKFCRPLPTTEIPS